jgi:hypothetical protein
VRVIPHLEGGIIEDIFVTEGSIVRVKRQTFDARASELASSLTVLRSQILQRALEIKEFEARRRALSTDLELASENFAISAELLAADLTPRVEHLEI